MNGTGTGTQDISTAEQLHVAIANQLSVQRIMGTPGYIAPEVYDGADSTAPVDAFALGVVLYQCITGRLPHQIGVTASGGPGGHGSDAARAYSVDLWESTVEGKWVPMDEFAKDLENLKVEIKMAKSVKELNEIQKRIGNAATPRVAGPASTGVTVVGPGGEFPRNEPFTARRGIA